MIRQTLLLISALPLLLSVNAGRLPSHLIVPRQVDMQVAQSAVITQRDYHEPTPCSTDVWYSDPTPPSGEVIADFPEGASIITVTVTVTHGQPSATTGVSFFPPSPDATSPVLSFSSLSSSSTTNPPSSSTTVPSSVSTSSLTSLEDPRAALLRENGLEAQRLNNEFRTLAIGDPCSETGETACINSQLGRCHLPSGQSNPTWHSGFCSTGGTQCYAVPIVDGGDGVDIGCFTREDAEARVTRAGLNDGLFANLEDVGSSASSLGGALSFLQSLPFAFITGAVLLY